jgi:hypothetical protein
MLDCLSRYSLSHAYHFIGVPLARFITSQMWSLAMIPPQPVQQSYTSFGGSPKVVFSTDHKWCRNYGYPAQLDCVDFLVRRGLLHFRSSVEVKWHHGLRFILR